jgi:CheY-like chemotaxis protein/anti-sigma regulatory factor (Ser/Thr protein kinase)
VRLRQVLMNLMSNALKFTDRGGITLHVRVEERLPGLVRLCFLVRDTGSGIPAEAQARLFNPFTQADDSVARRYGGTGLGLAICRRLVELMDGKIGVESTPGQGSLFWFTVPLHTAVAQPSVAPELAALAFAAGPRRRVLLADDNAVNRRVGQKMLERLGCEVSLVNDGQQAVAAMRGGEFDVVLMDCYMPQLDGFDATRAIRALELGVRRTPVIAMTASAFAEDRERCVAAGMDDYVSKPVDLIELQRKITQWSKARA